MGVVAYEPVVPVAARRSGTAVAVAPAGVAVLPVAADPSRYTHSD